MVELLTVMIYLSTVVATIVTAYYVYKIYKKLCDWDVGDSDGK